MPHPKTLIIVPAWNEQDSLAAVIAAIHTHVPFADIAVINDGSTDRTGEIADAHAATDSRVIPLHMPHNVGIGVGVQTGMIYAERGGYEVAVQTDGDGQHPPEQIPRLIERLMQGDADIVIGSRFIDRAGFQSSFARRVGIRVLSWLIRRITGEPITDPTSGFRASNRKTIRYCARDYPYDYPEPEAIVLLHRAGLRVREIPVTMLERQGGRSSITAFRSAYYMIKVILAILIGLLRAPIVVPD